VIAQLLAELVFYLRLGLVVGGVLLLAFLMHDQFPSLFGGEQ
jgi:hypothetical protein